MDENFSGKLERLDFQLNHFQLYTYTVYTHTHDPLNVSNYINFINLFYSFIPETKNFIHAVMNRI